MIYRKRGVAVWKTIEKIPDDGYSVFI